MSLLTSYNDEEGKFSIKEMKEKDISDIYYNVAMTDDDYSDVSYLEVKKLGNYGVNEQAIAYPMFLLNQNGRLILKLFDGTVDITDKYQEGFLPEEGVRYFDLTDCFD